MFSLCYTGSAEVGKSKFGVISGYVTSLLYPAILCVAFTCSLLPIMTLKWLPLHQLSHLGSATSTEALKQISPHISLART